MSRVTLFLSSDKACALCSVLALSLPKLRQEIIESGYDHDAIELYGHIDSICDEVCLQLYDIRSKKNDLLD